MNIKDIAKLANVSSTTVSRALNNKKDVSAETKKKILKIIEENNYRPNTIARNLVKNINNTIGIIVPDIKNLYFSSIMNEIVNIANKKNINVVLGCSNENFELQDKYIELFLAERFKAIFIVVTQNSNTKLEYFKKLSKKIPLVFIDRKISNKFSGVYIENFNTTYRSIEKMIEKGARKIAFITGPLDTSTAKERYEAYKEILKNNSIVYDEKLVFYGDFSLESGYIQGKKILKENIDSIYVSNNLMTLGFLKALKEANIDSKKYIISTFESNEILTFMEKSIYSNEIPFETIAEKSMYLLEKLINDKNYKESIEIVL